MHALNNTSTVTQFKVVKGIVYALIQVWGEGGSSNPSTPYLNGALHLRTIAMPPTYVLMISSMMLKQLQECMKSETIHHWSCYVFVMK
jgi:hypothetical protein